jgi:hypothetical protein
MIRRVHRFATGVLQKVENKREKSWEIKTIEANFLSSVHFS